MPDTEHFRMLVIGPRAAIEARPFDAVRAFNALRIAWECRHCGRCYEGYDAPARCEACQTAAEVGTS